MMTVVKSTLGRHAVGATVGDADPKASATCQRTTAFRNT
jgi:hypothetical protein